VPPVLPPVISVTLGSSARASAIIYPLAHTRSLHEPPRTPTRHHGKYLALQMPCGYHEYTLCILCGILVLGLRVSAVVLLSGAAWPASNHLTSSLSAYRPRYTLVVSIYPSSTILYKKFISIVVDKLSLATVGAVLQDLPQRVCSSPFVTAIQYGCSTWGLYIECAERGRRCQSVLRPFVFPPFLFPGRCGTSVLRICSLAGLVIDILFC
jgi:hypothetical protein